MVEALFPRPRDMVTERNQITTSLPVVRRASLACFELHLSLFISFEVLARHCAARGLVHQAAPLGLPGRLSPSRIDFAWSRSLNVDYPSIVLRNSWLSGEQVQLTFNDSYGAHRVISACVEYSGQRLMGEYSGHHAPRGCAALDTIADPTRPYLCTRAHNPE